MSLLQNLQTRYACKAYDSTRKVCSRPLKSHLITDIQYNIFLNSLINLQVFVSLQRETCRFHDYKASS